MTTSPAFPHLGTHRYGKSYKIVGDRIGYTYRRGSHWPRLPHDLPESLERFGLCTCRECLAHALAHPLWRKAWQTAWSAHTLIGSPGPAVRSEGWRTLSWSVGDDGADWLTGWCDLDPPNAHARLDALVTVCNLLDGNDPILVGSGVQAGLWGLVDRSEGLALVQETWAAEEAVERLVGPSARRVGNAR